MKIRINKLILLLIFTSISFQLKAYYGKSFGYPYSYGFGGYSYPGPVFYHYDNPYFDFNDIW